MVEGREILRMDEEEQKELGERKDIIRNLKKKYLEVYYTSSKLTYLNALIWRRDGFGTYHRNHQCVCMVHRSSAWIKPIRKRGQNRVADDFDDV